MNWLREILLWIHHLIFFNRINLNSSFLLLWNERNLKIVVKWLQEFEKLKREENETNEIFHCHLLSSTYEIWIDACPLSDRIVTSNTYCNYRSFASVYEFQLLLPLHIYVFALCRILMVREWRWRGRQLSESIEILSLHSN